MKEIKGLPAVIEVCDELMASTGSQFVALAMQNEVGPDVRWHYASGNLNDKYKRITVRFGKGIAGKIISSGSPMMVTDFPNGISGKVTDHPIMLAEKLVSSYAVPLFFNAVPKGVLLIGNRISTAFTDESQQQVQEAAHILEEILKDQILL